MKRFTLFHQILLGGVILCTLLALGAFFVLNYSTAAPTTPTPEASQQVDQATEIEAAIQAEMGLEAQAAPMFQLYDNIVENVRVSQDGSWATAWLTPVDPDTGEIVPAEPGLVLLQRVNGQWQVYLPSEAEWVEAVRQAPEDLVPIETKLDWVQQADVAAQAAPAAALTGYRLPFPGGDTRRLTQSVGHDRYTASGNAHYSFDFATAYPSTLFQVVAAKGGTVYRVRWTQANGDPAEPGNYIVLQDTSTVPTTYQLYLHFAQDSIPAELRLIGAPVRRGQYLGMADDTGVSSGHHLHFHVHTTATSYWGRSVDIVFEDVAINGGRPRISSDLSYCNSGDVCSSTQIDYLSQNYLNPDPTPPTGGLSAPQTGAVVAAGAVSLQGFAQDTGSGIYSAQFIANYDGTWRPVGSTFSTGTFAYTWDLCAAGAPDGPISVALDIRDKAFNKAPGLPGLTHFTKNFACPAPPPACAPSASQVALFANPYFQGNCVVLGAGSYTTASALGAVGDDNVSSIQVGANVRLTAYQNTGLQGRSETFLASDSDLEDNRINANTISSLLVQTRTAAPAVPAPVWPTAGATFTADAPLTLSWNDAGGGSQFQARLMLGATQVQSTPWQSDVFWHISALAPGSYTWQVKSRAGTTESAWSAGRALVITPAAAVPGGGVSAPFSDPLESAGAWTHSGSWVLSSAANHTLNGANSWKYAPTASHYDTGATNAGYLTSPPIAIPAGSVQYLRFWYQYETESSDPLWDQRWVQISANGGPFANMLQLYDDAPNYWLSSPAISLQAYAGQSIRVRFYFATLDAGLNGYKGWFIDDFAVDAAPPPACGDSNGSAATASDLALGGAANGVICPGGDVDYYRFLGNTGDLIGAWTQAQSLGSPLDTHLTLLDRDGRTVLMRNDDFQPGVRSDSWVRYQLPAQGTYFLKVRSWDHPTSGGPNLNYTLRVAKDTQDPVGAFTYPVAGRLQTGPVTLTVSATDAHSGVSRVRFFWHSNDWLGGRWITLGDDVNGADGWSVSFDTSHAAGLYGGAVYAQIYDWTGNWSGAGVWNLTPPGIYLPLISK